MHYTYNFGTQYRFVFASRVFAGQVFADQAAMIDKELDRFTRPGSHPVLGLLEQVLELPPETILNELKTRLLAIDNLFRKAVQIASTPRILELFAAVQSGMTNLFNSIVSVVSSGGSSQTAVATLQSILLKLAAIDPAKYNAVVMKINELKDDANQIDGAISNLAGEIRQQIYQGQSGVQPPGELQPPGEIQPLSLGETPGIEAQEQKPEDAGSGMVGKSKFPPSFKEFFDKISNLNDQEYSDYKAVLQNEIYKANPEVMITRVAKALDVMRNLGRTGFALHEFDPSSQESTGYLNRYKYINEDLATYAKELKSKTFEELVIEHPELLWNIAATQIKLEGKKFRQKSSQERKEDKAKAFLRRVEQFIQTGHEDAPIGAELLFRFNQLTTTAGDHNDFGITSESTFTELFEVLSRYAITLGAKPKKGPTISVTDLTKGDEERTFDFVAPILEMESNLGPEMKAFFDKFGLKSEDILFGYRDKANEFLSSSVVPKIEANPASLQTVRFPEGMSEQEREAALTNNAAINYSLYQLHGNHLQITALLKEAKEAQSSGRAFSQDFYRNIQDQIRKVMTMCFPEQMVSAARAKMMPTDKGLFSSGTIKKTGPEGVPPKDTATPFLFDVMPETYEAAIDKVTNHLFRFSSPESPEEKVRVTTQHKTLKKDVYKPSEGGRGWLPPYFSFAGGRAGLGYILGPFYGGSYKRNTGLPGDYNSVIAANPNYVSNKIVLSSLTDYNAPFWGTGKKNPATGVSDFVRNMTNITSKVRDFIVSQPMPDEVKFYLSYMAISANSTLKSKIELGKPVDQFKQDLMEMMKNWKTEYEFLSGAKIASSKYFYHYSLKSLFV